MKRRTFIADSVRIALGARAAVLLSGALPATLLADASIDAFDERETRTLVAMTRALFPHRDLDDRYYVAVVEQLDAQAASSDDFASLIRSGIAALDTMAGGSWIDASADAKLAALEAIQTEQFFGAVLNMTIDVLYRNPDVLTMLGYQGSSIEYGGYINRGFDDIDWLPES